MGLTPAHGVKPGRTEYIPKYGYEAERCTFAPAIPNSPDLLTLSLVLSVVVITLDFDQEIPVTPVRAWE